MNRLTRWVIRWTRALARWNHRQHAQDLAHVVEHHRRMLAGLPGEIDRLELLRRWHTGRADTLAARKNVVSFRFVGGRR